MAEIEPGQLAQSFELSEDWAIRLEKALAKSFMSSTIWHAFCAGFSGNMPSAEELHHTLNLIFTIAGV